jgi:hypothetical protein
MEMHRHNLTRESDLGVFIDQRLSKCGTCVLSDQPDAKYGWGCGKIDLGEKE